MFGDKLQMEAKHMRRFGYFDPEEDEKLEKIRK